MILDNEITDIEFIKKNQKAYIKKVTDSENITKIIKKLKQMKLNRKLDDSYKGWVISITLNGKNKQTISFLNDKVFIGDSWYSVDSSVLSDIENLYKELNVNEEEYKPTKIRQAF